MNIVAGACILCLFFSIPVQAAVVVLADALGITGETDIERSLGANSVDSGTAYILATLEVSNVGALDTAQAYGGIGVNLSLGGPAFDFGQPWEQTQWGTGGAKPGGADFPNTNGVIIALDTPVTVVLKYDYKTSGENGIYEGVYFNPTLTTTENNNSLFVDGGTVSNSMPSVWYRVGSDTTDNTWNFTNVRVYTDGDTPFESSVPEPAAALLLACGATILFALRRKNS